MKKFLVLLLGALVVLSFATVSFAIHDEASVIEAGAAVAEPGTAFVLGGDARVRGVSKKNYALDDGNNGGDGEDTQYYDSRARFTIDAKTAGGIELRTRMTLGNYGDNYNWGEGNVKTVNWDWAYIHAPIGPVAVDAGNMRFNWGHKFLAWDLPVDRLMVSGKFNNVTVGIGTDKISEAGADNVDDNGDGVGGDYDDVFGLVGVDVAGWNLNLLYISYKDGRPLATDSDCASPGYCNNPGADENGSVYDIFVNGKIGPVGAHLEYAQTGGKLFETTNLEGDTGHPGGAYIAFDYGTEQFVVFGAYAFTRDGYIADNDFAPNMFFGTVQNTAMTNYGALGDVDGDGALTSIDAADMDAIVVGGAYNVNEALSFGARITSATVKEWGTDIDASGDITDGTIFAWQAQGDYKLSKNLTYTLAYGSATFGGDMFKDAGMDDTATVAFNMLNYQF